MMIWMAGVIDSGSSDHMVNSTDQLINLQKAQRSFKQADGTSLDITSKGTANLIVSVGSQQQVHEVTNVLYSPKLSTDLFSVSTTCLKGNAVIFKGDKAYICNAPDVVIPKALKAVGNLCSDKLYRLKTNTLSSADLSSNESPSLLTVSTLNDNQPKDLVSSKLWHRRLGHLSLKSVKELVTPFGELLPDSDPDCQVCASGKLSRAAIHTPCTVSRQQESLGMVHTDVCGPLSTPSVSGARYFVTFTDDHSRKSWVKALKTKADTFSAFAEFKALSERESGLKLKCLRADRGGEYTSNEFKAFCVEHGIKLEYAPPRTPEYNGVAERLNRTLEERVTCMMVKKAAPLELWAECLNSANYLRNLSPTETLGGKSPQEVWSGQKPTLKYLRVWGSPADVLIPKDQRKKFGVKSWRGRFVGYEDKAYRIYDATTRSIKLTRDVRILENKEWGASDVEQQSEEQEPHRDVSQPHKTKTVTFNLFFPENEQHEVRNEDSAIASSSGAPIHANHQAQSEHSAGVQPHFASEPTVSEPRTIVSRK